MCSLYTKKKSNGNFSYELGEKSLIQVLVVIVNQVVTVVFAQFGIDSLFIIHWLNIGIGRVVMIWAMPHEKMIEGDKVVGCDNWHRIGNGHNYSGWFARS